jgi:beta-hydroxylase
VPTVLPAPPKVRRRKPVRLAVKALKRVVPVALLAWFLPWVLAAYLAMGLVDACRNRPLTLSVLDKYFFGNGVLTWLLAPFNLLMDVLCLPYRNRGIYRLEDLPAGHRAEIQTLIDAARKRDVVGQLSAKLGDVKRGMVFWRWYGQALPTTVDVPEFSQKYKYIRTVGCSIFNKRASTGKHFGPLRVTLRVLYNVNDITDPNVYIQVGDRVHRWRDGKLFVFDDTLQHQSVNESDGVRYCLFVDILRPSPVPWLLGGVLTGIRLVTAPARAVFYKHWTFLK